MIDVVKQLDNELSQEEQRENEDKMRLNEIQDYEEIEHDIGISTSKQNFKFTVNREDITIQPTQFDSWDHNNVNTTPD